MNKLILLIISAVALQAQTAVINGATARFRITTSTSAPSSTACDASNEVGNLHVRTGNQSSVPTYVSVCKQTGASTYAWGPIGWYSQTTAPATCTVGEIWFDTDASAGSNLNLCTSSNTFTAVSGGGGGGTPAGSNTYVQYNSSGSFGAEAAFAYDASTNTLTVESISLGNGTDPTQITLKCGTAPSTPASDKVIEYCESDRPKFKTDAGTVYAVNEGVSGAYDATSWNGNNDAPTKDAVRDKIESLSVGSAGPAIAVNLPFTSFLAGTGNSAASGWYLDTGVGASELGSKIMGATFANTGTPTATTHVRFPRNFTGTINAVVWGYNNNGGSGDAVKLEIALWCPNAGDTPTPTYNTSSTSEFNPSGWTKTTFTGISYTGCATDDVMYVQFLRNNTTSGTNINNTYFVDGVGLFFEN